MTGYLPGDPRYGLSGEALRNYYRTKSAQWAIYCWDKPGTAETRRGLVQDQKTYVKGFGARVIGSGHFVSGGGRIRRGRAYEQGRRLPARRNSPLVEQLPEARGRLSPQGHAAVPVHGTQDRHARILPRAPARARVILRVVRRQLHLLRTDSRRRLRRQHRHRAAARAAGPGGGGQVLERGAVCQERRISAGRADHAVGVWRLTGAG